MCRCALRARRREPCATFASRVLLAWRVIMPKKILAMFSHKPEVGEKCKVILGYLACSPQPSGLPRESAASSLVRARTRTPALYSPWLRWRIGRLDHAAEPSVSAYVVMVRIVLRRTRNVRGNQTWANSLLPAARRSGRFSASTHCH